jgi:hypothetical protein
MNAARAAPMITATAIFLLSLHTAASDDAEAEAFRAQLPRLRAIQARFEEKIFAGPTEGFNSIGIGLAKDGKTPVFRVVLNDRALLETFPKSVEGVAVELAIAGPVRLMDGGPSCNGGAGPPCHRNPLPFPIEMGNSGAWVLATGNCTMGFKACDRTTFESVMITCSHCAQYDNGCAQAGIGDSVEHPSPNDQMPANSGVSIGTITGHQAPVCTPQVNNYVDATKVASPFFKTSKKHRDIGNPPGSLSNPLPNWGVHYSGRTVGYNPGTIVAVGVTVNIPAGAYCCGPLVMKDQISVDPTHLLGPGDSGAGLLMNRPSQPTQHNRVLGLVFAGDGMLAYANNIDRITSALNVTFDFTVCGFPATY